MKRIKRDCDADNHASSRLAIRNTTITVENLHELVRKRCGTCIEIFLDSPMIKKPWFFNDLIKNLAPIADIKDLIETYPHILERRNDDGESLLIVAVLHSLVEVVQLILDANEESLDYGPLKLAITNKQIEIVEILTRPEILMRFRQSDIELAFKATIEWFPCPEPVFSALLAKMNRRSLRETLNLCIAWNNFEAFKAILLHDRALVNVYGPGQGRNLTNLATTTPLHLVVDDDRFDFIEFILDNFAESVNLELRNSNGRTAFECALVTVVPPEILKKFLNICPQLIHAVVDTKNVSAARLFLREYGCISYPKEDIEGRFKLIWSIMKCDLDYLEALSNDQEEMANILFDFVFEEDAVKVYPFEYLLEITAWSFIRPMNSISDKCLKLFYLYEENRERDLIERALRILKLNEINLKFQGLFYHNHIVRNVQGQLFNGRCVLFWLHGKYGYNELTSCLTLRMNSLMDAYTEKIVEHLYEEVFEDKEKLAVYYEILYKINDQVWKFTSWFVEDYILPSFISSEDPNALKQLQIVYDALYLSSPQINFIGQILGKYEIDEIKDFIKSGLFQLFLAFSPFAQNQIFDGLKEYDDDEVSEVEEKRQLLPIVEPFLSIENRKDFGLNKNPIPLQELARLSVLKQLNGAKEWRCSDFIDRIDKLKLPTLMKNYLLYMDKTLFKIFKN